MNARGQLLRAEGPFTRGAPNIDAFGIQNQDPGIPPGQGLPEPVETHFIVSGDQDWRAIIGAAEGVEAGLDLIAHPSDPPADLEHPPVVHCP